ncbi:MAG: hypothetical protein H6577_04635 [Lewinellaceae bacterium]|nr:hypothetical protein [Lewinellaceae bacterium]
MEGFFKNKIVILFFLRSLIGEKKISALVGRVWTTYEADWILDHGINAGRAIFKHRVTPMERKTLQMLSSTKIPPRWSKAQLP